MPKPTPDRRDDYLTFVEMTTRWRDNDVYGHMNNVVYYEYIDTAVNRWLIDGGLLDFHAGEVIGLVVETSCAYFDAAAYPDRMTAGVRVDAIGRTSVTYGVGLFRNAAETAAAQGRFTHVYVDRATRRPTPLSDAWRQALLGIASPTAMEGG